MDAPTLTAIALVITSVGSLLAAAGTFYGIHLTRKQNVKLDKHGEKLEAVEKHTNGLASALGAAKLAQGTAEGTAVGLEQGRQEASDAKAAE